ncbi:MAG: nitroreductase [Thermoprotei archaeon]|nr:MAG: nitroreductase [Thermoprotei archaeon]
MGNCLKPRVAIIYAVLLISLAIIVYLGIIHLLKVNEEQRREYLVKESVVLLPLPRIGDNVISVERALANRRSIRSYLDKPLTIHQVSQLLWAAYGINDVKRGFKTCPSAGATYPLEIYLIVGENCVKVNETHYLSAGCYKYSPRTHALFLVKEGDLRSKLAAAALGQEWVETAPIDIIICAVYERTVGVYGERGYRYVHMEAGHAGQNIYLEATALGLGTVVVGAFHDDEVRKIIGAKSNEHPLYIIPVGYPKQPYSIEEEDLWDYIMSMRKKTGLMED